MPCVLCSITVAGRNTRVVDGARGSNSGTASRSGEELKDKGSLPCPAMQACGTGEPAKWSTFGSRAISSWTFPVELTPRLLLACYRTCRFPLSSCPVPGQAGKQVSSGMNLESSWSASDRELAATAAWPVARATVRMRRRRHPGCVKTTRTLLKMIGLLLGSIAGDRNTGCVAPIFRKTN